MNLSDYQKSTLQHMGIDLYQSHETLSASVTVSSDIQPKEHHKQPQDMHLPLVQDALFALAQDHPWHHQWFIDEQATAPYLKDGDLYTSNDLQTPSNKRALWALMSDVFDAKQFS